MQETIRQQPFTSFLLGFTRFSFFFNCVIRLISELCILILYVCLCVCSLQNHPCMNRCHIPLTAASRRRCNRSDSSAWPSPLLAVIAAIVFDVHAVGNALHKKLASRRHGFWSWTAKGHVEQGVSAGARAGVCLCLCIWVCSRLLKPHASITWDEGHRMLNCLQVGRKCLFSLLFHIVSASQLHCCSFLRNHWVALTSSYFCCFWGVVVHHDLLGENHQFKKIPYRSVGVLEGKGLCFNSYDSNIVQTVETALLA